MSCCELSTGKNSYHFTSEGEGGGGGGGEERSIKILSPQKSLPNETQKYYVNMLVYRNVTRELYNVVCCLSWKVHQLLMPALRLYTVEPLIMGTPNKGCNKKNLSIV